MTQKQTLPVKTAESRLVVVIRGQHAEDYVPVIDTMVNEGVRSFELTLTTPGTMEALPGLVTRYGADADLGVGTITRPEEVDRATDGGAHYAVTPISTAEVVDRALARGLPLIPGGFTPTEVHSTWSRGVAAVKVFPANRVGTGYLKDLRGPFPDIRVIPSGGIDLAAAREWLAAGAEAVSVGGPLLGDSLKGGDLGELAQRTRRFVSATAREDA